MTQQERAWQKSYADDLYRRLSPLRTRTDETIFFEQSGSQYVTVTKESDHVLLWLLDCHADGSGVIQSELDLSDPLRLVDPYTQATLLSLLWSPHPRRIYTAGLGGGCLPMTLHYHFPDALIHCVEIDPAVIRAATECFGFRTDDSLHLALADGRAWLTATSPTPPYDLIILDAFLDNGYAPYAMATREFATLCAQRLAANGVLVVNLLYLDRFYLERVRSLSTEFEHLYLLRMGEDNDLLFAAHEPLPSLPARSAAVATVTKELGIRYPLAEWADRLIPLGMADLPGLDQARVLTDDAPPPAYFEALPALDADDVRWPPDHACPCGSGLAFRDCHGS